MTAEYLQIDVSNNRTLEATLNKRGGCELAIMLPGLRYSAEMPLFYYAEQMMDERGIDTLSVNFEYDRDNEFLTAPDDERLEWLKSDGRKILEFISNIGSYDRLTIIGKSLGTISMGWAVDKYPNARLVWLTPSLTGTGLLEQMLGKPNRAFSLIGTRDPANQPEYIDALAADENISLATVEGANHGFSHPDGTTASVAVVQEAVEKLSKWLDVTS